jgi:NTE family protein
LFRDRTKKLNLALQGGGAHGAFTWGVLDRLLEEDRIAIGWVSGTSAGAVNAAALASGLATGGAAKARETLAAVWGAVEKAGLPDFMRLMPFMAGFARAAPLPDITAVLSPYEFNPLDINPLRRLLAGHIAFDEIRAREGPELLIAATDASTGRPRLFRRRELTVDMVLASACLPTIHHAVEIEGRAYWDGGFSANPDLLTLASQSPVKDTLLVQLNPLERHAVPKTARQIAAQVNTITFNQPLLRDVELIVAAREEQGGLFNRSSGRGRRLAHARFHLIEAGRFTSKLAADSKLKPERGLFEYLFSSGRMEAARFLERHGRDVGRRSSVDLRARFLDDRPISQTQPSLADSDGEPGRANDVVDRA